MQPLPVPIKKIWHCNHGLYHWIAWMQWQKFTYGVLLQACKTHPLSSNLGWGRTNCPCPKLQNCSLQNEYGTMVFLNSWFTIMTCILLHHSGWPCGPCSEFELWLVVLTIYRLTVRRNVRIALSNRVFVLLFMRVLTMGWRLFHLWNCVNNAVAESTRVLLSAFMYG